MIQHKNTKTTVDVLLICAQKDEYDQVLKVTDGIQAIGWVEYPLSNRWMVADANFTTTSGRSISIRATHASYMGREQAQATASQLIREQPARCIAMSGICAGRRGKVALGDVIFAERLWSYDAGKISVKNGKTLFHGDQLQYRPSPTWVQRMQHVSIPLPDKPWLSLRPKLPLEYQEDWVLLRVFAGEDPRQHTEFDTACPDWSNVVLRLRERKWLEKQLTLTSSGQTHAEELNFIHPKDFPAPSNFKIHVAPMATGAAVSEDESIFPHLAESMRKVLGIEMEASALGALGEAHNIPVLVAKGVSDYGDPFKDDRYREFAARASAECLIDLLRNSADLLSSNQDELSPTIDKTNDNSTPLSKVSTVQSTLPNRPHKHLTLSRLTGKEQRDLEQLLCSIFTQLDDLERMLSYELEEAYPLISGQPNLKIACFRLVKWAEAQGKLSQLLEAIKIEAPDNPQLKLFFTALGL